MKNKLIDAIPFVLAGVLVLIALGQLGAAQTDLADKQAGYIDAVCSRITAPIECQRVK